MQNNGCKISGENAWWCLVKLKHYFLNDLDNNCNYYNYYKINVIELYTIKFIKSDEIHDL